MAENFFRRRQRTEWDIKIKYSAVKFFLENPTASQKKYLADFNIKSEKKICKQTLSGWLKLANEIKNKYETEVLSDSLGEEEKAFKKVLITSAKTYPVTKPVADKKQESSDSSSSEEERPSKKFRPSVKNIDHSQPQM